MGGKIISDSEIIKNVIKALDTNPNRMAVRLGYSSASSVRHVVDGRNQISVSMANKIVEVYDQVNFLYLMTGEGDPLISGGEKIGQDNMFRGMGFDLNDIGLIPGLLKEQNKLLREIRDSLQK